MLQAWVHPHIPLHSPCPGQDSSQSTACGVGCAPLPLSSSTQALGQSDTCVTSPKLHACNNSRLLLISHPELGWEKFANQKCHRHRSRARVEKSHSTEMFLFEERNKLFNSFSPTLPALPGPLSSWERAAGVAARQQHEGTRGNLSPEAGNPQERTIQGLFVQSRSKSAKGYSEDGNWGCRQGGGLLSQGQTSLTEVVSLEDTPHPREIPTRFPCSAFQPRCLN